MSHHIDHPQVLGSDCPRWGRVRGAGRRSILLAIAMCGAACVSGLGPSEGPLLLTNAQAYDLVVDAQGVGVSIPYTFLNETGGPVYLASCGDRFQFHLERDIEGVWVQVWHPIYGACLPTRPIVIERGELWADTLAVWGGRPGCNCLPRFDVADPSGRYRLVWEGGLTSFQPELPQGPLLPLAARTSNVFRLSLR